MAAQNIYDNPEFLAGYQTLSRQVDGLDGAAEWPTMRDMLPDLTGARVVDLGCGFGWFSRWADEQGASSVVAVDVSTKMLERAVAETDAATIDYRQVDLDELELGANSADVVFSSLTFHYVQDLQRLFSMLGSAVVPGGSMVFSVEHPILSAPTSQQFETSQAGDRVWPLNNYLVEGQRTTNWFVDGVIKEHRAIATYVNAVIDAGFVLDHIVEFGHPGDAALAPADDLHRPWFLLLRASKPAV